VRLAQGRAREALPRVQQLVQSWESAHPGSAFHGESLYWLAQLQQASGQGSDAARNLRAAREMLAGAKAPFLRRL
jgi:TolA-binding protein